MILGAGQIGASLAANLVGEHNDITVVSADPHALKTLRERYDLRTVTGFPSHPVVLEKAGAEDADMLIAVTDSDEINMLACQVAYTLFHTPTKIAQVRNRAYLDHAQLFCQEAMPVDLPICPEQIITEHTKRLVRYPSGVLQALDFADGKVQLMGIRLHHQVALVGKSIAECSRSLPKVDFRVAMVYRHDRPILPNGETVLEADDEIFIVVAKKHVRALLQVASISGESIRNIVIAGGGQIGRSLARALEKDYFVKLIEVAEHSANLASEQLKNTTVLRGDIVDREYLLEASIEQADAFCAVTNIDESNIFSAMMAKHLGAKKVFALINNINYIDLLLDRTIDIVISPQQITIGLLLAYMRRGDVKVVHSLRRGAMESLEAIAHAGSKVVGRTIAEIDLPPGTVIAAIVRDEKVVIAHKTSHIEDGDHFILLISNKKYLHHVESLFRVGVTVL